jgi:hypothetical protein
MSAIKSVIRCHIHLEQATATVDNSVTLFMPMCVVATNASDNPTGFNANGPIMYYLGTKVSVKQYNSFQKLGTEGLEFEDAVTGLEVTS